MKAVVVTDYGDVDKLELREVPPPHADPRGIVVRVAGAGINPIDWKMRAGATKAWAPLRFPAILGRDASGVVVEVGREVSEFRVGDRVMGVVHGAYAELVAAPADAWVPVPDGMDLVDAGALPLALLTGAELAEEAVAPARGDKVLVTGAVGSVGRVATYAARVREAKVYAGVLRSQVAVAAELGTEGVVALDDDSEIAKLPTLDAVADTVDGDTIRKLLGKVKPGGTIGSVLGEPAGAKERGIVVHSLVSYPDQARLARMAWAAAIGTLRVPIAEKLPLARAAEAQRLAEAGHVGGKVVLVA